MPGIVGALAVLAVAAVLAVVRMNRYRPSHGGPVLVQLAAVAPNRPPWAPAPPPAAVRQSMCVDTAGPPASAAERLTAPRVAAGRLARVEVIRAFYAAADAPVAAVLAAASWPVGLPPIVGIDCR